MNEEEKPKKRNVFSPVVRECSKHCVNVGQDKLYGKGKRVHNACVRKGTDLWGYRCTVCGNVINV